MSTAMKTTSIKTAPIRTAPIRTAMVLAAGLGTRMRPLTNDRCKALVDVGGKTLIDHMLDRLAKAGIERAIVNVHAFADKLETHLKTRPGLPEIIISDEREALLETGGGLVKALPLLGEDPILICNIDAVWLEFEPALEGLITAWDPAEMDELLLLAPRADSLGYDGHGDFDLSPEGHITRRKSDQAHWVYAGVQVFKPALAQDFEIAAFSRNKIWDVSFTKQRIYGHKLPAYWMHVGDPRARKAAQLILDSHEDVHIDVYAK